jgi:hypothetical protein
MQQRGCLLSLFAGLTRASVTSIKQPHAVAFSSSSCKVKLMLLLIHIDLLIKKFFAQLTCVFSTVTDYREKLIKAIRSIYCNVPVRLKKIFAKPHLLKELLLESDGSPPAHPFMQRNPKLKCHPIKVII